jgi:hypothetical protein
MSARADLCGGRSAMIVPTATSSSAYDYFPQDDVSGPMRQGLFHLCSPLKLCQQVSSRRSSSRRPQFLRTRAPSSLNGQRPNVAGNLPAAGKLKLLCLL